MKKFFILLAFLFAVVCYAAPPPDVPALTDEVQYVVQQPVSDFVVSIEAQEVAFYRIGYVYSCAKTALINESAMEIQPVEMQKRNSYTEMLPTVDCTSGVISSENNFCLNRITDKQHSNYAYPFGANYFFS